VSPIPKQLELVGLVGLGVLFYFHCTHFTFVQDDAFITFRYVQNFLDGNGLVFNIGEHVEGYTNFLWTLLLALPAALGIDLIDVAHGLGLAAGIATLYLLYQLSQAVFGGEGAFLAPLVAVTLTASNSSIAYWTISGMETPLFMLLLVASSLAYVREAREAGRFLLTPLLLVLLSLTRPEGMMVYGITVMHFAATVLVRHRGFPSREVTRFPTPTTPRPGCLKSTSMQGSTTFSSSPGHTCFTDSCFSFPQHFCFGAVARRKSSTSFSSAQDTPSISSLSGGMCSMPFAFSFRFFPFSTSSYRKPFVSSLQ
jgi:hypothetical protein